MGGTCTAREEGAGTHDRRRVDGEVHAWRPKRWMNTDFGCAATVEAHSLRVRNGNAREEGAEAHDRRGVDGDAYAWRPRR